MASGRVDGTLSTQQQTMCHNLRARVRKCSVAVCSGNLEGSAANAKQRCCEKQESLQGFASLRYAGDKDSR